MKTHRIFENIFTFAKISRIMLDTEFQYYLSHQKELVKKYNGKHIVIIGTTVVGAYESHIDAVLKSRESYKPGTFLVQKCSQGNRDYTVMYHSHIKF